MQLKCFECGNMRDAGLSFCPWCRTSSCQSASSLDANLADQRDDAPPVSENRRKATGSEYERGAEPASSAEPFAGPPPVRRMMEVVYTWPNGREEVRYRRLFPSAEAWKLIRQVAWQIAQHGKKSPYSWRFVKTNSANSDTVREIRD